MKWFKHDTTALSDAKIEKLIMKFGLEGYGLYFACLELIAASLTIEKCDFTLEHDAFLLSHKFSKKPERIQEILDYCVEINLLQYDPETNSFMCLNLARRLDNTLAQNPEVKKIINGGDFKKIKETLNNLKQIRLDKNRLDIDKIKGISESSPSSPKFRYKENSTRWEKYNKNITVIIEHYNKLRNKKLNPRTENYVQLIGILLNYGYTKEQCIMVVDYMWKEWQTEEKMSGYHRPETLFAYSKFQKYLPDATEWAEKKEAKKTEQIKKNVPVELQRDPEMAKKKLKEVREMLK